MIYKQEAIDAIEVYRRNTEHILGEDSEIVKAIKTCEMLVQEVEETERWIPVSERLPEFVKTVNEGYMDEMQLSDIVLVTNGKEIGPSELVKDGETDESFWAAPCGYEWPIGVHMDANEIIAWMPLPEPYKEVEDHDQN